MLRRGAEVFVTFPVPAQWPELRLARIGIDLRDRVARRETGCDAEVGAGGCGRRYRPLDDDVLRTRIQRRRGVSTTTRPIVRGGRLAINAALAAALVKRTLRGGPLLRRRNGMS